MSGMRIQRKLRLAAAAVSQSFGTNTHGREMPKIRNKPFDNWCERRKLSFPETDVPPARHLASFIGNVCLSIRTTFLARS